MCRETLIAVGIDVRHDGDDEVFQQWPLFRQRDVAGQHQHAFLAIDFTGMNVCLDKDDQLAALRRLGRG